MSLSVPAICESDHPSLSEKVLDHPEEHGIGGQFGAFAAFETLASSAQTRDAGIVNRRGVGSLCRPIRPGRKRCQLPADGRRRAAQHQRDLPRRAVVRLHLDDRRSFFSGELFVVPSHGGSIPVG